ncbi:hypothetical protein [Lichenicoccus sp.]|uniref:hypothetical protein n=1 Tax=Lichenicoccus sp. TaxID=2781899 RepID=UPI003D097706
MRETANAAELRNLALRSIAARYCPDRLAELDHVMDQAAHVRARTKRDIRNKAIVLQSHVDRLPIVDFGQWAVIGSLLRDIISDGR